MERELKKMLKNDFTPLLTRENIIGYVGKRIDRNFLIENIINFNQHFSRKMKSFCKLSAHNCVRLNALKVQKNMG